MEPVSTLVAETPDLLHIPYVYGNSLLQAKNETSNVIGIGTKIKKKNKKIIKKKEWAKRKIRRGSGSYMV